MSTATIVRCSAVCCALRAPLDLAHTLTRDALRRLGAHPTVAAARRAVERAIGTEERINSRGSNRRWMNVQWQANAHKSHPLDAFATQVAEVLPKSIVGANF